LTTDAVRLAAFLLVTAVLSSGCGSNSDAELIVGATTSVQDTGLLDALVEAFEDASEYDVKQVVGGPGQTLEMARRGEFDVTLTHSPADEDKFIADGEGLDKRTVMQNFFLVAGPEEDPAAVAGVTRINDAFQRIAEREHRFISRGDNSGTHRRELAIWQEVGIEPKGRDWYEESASGQGQNVLLANDKDAYTLVDSSTFTVFMERVDLRALLTDEGDPNVYLVIRISPDKHDEINAPGAIAFADFLTSSAGQCLIAEFGAEEYGEPLFEAASGCQRLAQRLTPH
jgi:tungstate transport system substrate-binding protein